MTTLPAQSYVGAESLIIEAWLRSVLGAPDEPDGTDSTPSMVLSGHGITGIYDSYAPTTAQYPFVVWHQQSAINVRSGMDRWMVNTLYVVRAVSMVDSYEPLREVAAAIDHELNGKTVAFQGGYIDGVSQEEPFKLTELHDGQQIRHLGGLYRIFAQAQ